MMAVAFEAPDARRISAEAAARAVAVRLKSLCIVALYTRDECGRGEGSRSGGV